MQPHTLLNQGQGGTGKWCSIFNLLYYAHIAEKNSPIIPTIILNLHLLRMSSSKQPRFRATSLQQPQKLEHAF